MIKKQFILQWGAICIYVYYYKVNLLLLDKQAALKLQRL